MNHTSKILVVEDQKIDRLTVVRILELKFKKENIIEAEDGKQAYELYKKHKPDIILTDIRMPRMNGIELIEKIREEDKITPIVVISAFEKEIFKIDELLINHYLLKPVTIMHLYNIIYEFIHE